MLPVSVYIPDFALTAIRAAMNTEAHPSLRLAAAVQLKHYISRYWESGGSTETGNAGDVQETLFSHDPSPSVTVNGVVFII